MAIAAFLQSVKPVSHSVPGPFKPGEEVSTFIFKILPRWFDALWPAVSWTGLDYATLSSPALECF